MKKILKPQQREEALFYSDFTGKPLGNMGYEPVGVKITCNYGSKFDGSEITLHLDDDDLLQLIDFLKTKVSEDFKNQIKNSMKKLDKDHEDCFQARDWQSVEYIQNNMDLLKLLL
jgi:hypothetical protein